MGGRSAGVIACAALSAWAHAYPTSLVFMPIADTLGHREAVYYVSGIGESGRYAWGHGATLGLGGSLEVGFDNDTLGSTVVDAKLLVAEGPRWALSAGLMNVPLNGGGLSKYAVGRYDVSERLRLHAGWLFDDRHRQMVGGDYDLGNDWSLAFEHISGPDAGTWTAVNIPLPAQGFSLMIGVGLANGAGTLIQHQVYLSYGFRL